MTTYLIYTAGYDENAGGRIALHRLCDSINRLGEIAKLWPLGKVRLDRKTLLRSLTAKAMYPIVYRKGYHLCPGLITPLAQWCDLDDCVVVYPEIVAGNPLGAKRVVRWLLNKPGFFTGKAEFETDDLFFFYNHAFIDPRLNIDLSNQLCVLNLLRHIYQRWNVSERIGGCYMVRKGANRSLNAHPPDFIKVDGLSHQATANVFNRVNTFISYDSYTLYSAYAAICGCDSVVVPVPGVSREQWRPDVHDGFGIAYGFEDIPRARAELPLLVSHLDELERRSDDSVRAFLRKTSIHFGFSS